MCKRKEHFASYAQCRFFIYGHEVKPAEKLRLTNLDINENRDCFDTFVVKNCCANEGQCSRLNSSRMLVPVGGQEALKLFDLKMDTKDLSKRRQIFASRYRTTQKTSASLLCDHRTYVKIVFGTLSFLNTRIIFLLTDVTTHLPSAILSYRIPTSNEKRVYWM